MNSANLRTAIAAIVFAALPGTVLAHNHDIGAPCCPFSDARLKSSIEPLTDSTSQLLKLQGVHFNWKDTGRSDIGLVAQDVQAVYPQLVHEKEGALSVDYQKLVAPLIESVRQLNLRIEALEKTRVH
ncbi:tail fiber domain-containing protein [Pseudomonas fakonensis]|uniref:Tail fiber domain-containing protein n=1 Tax=Pseudomonas fakonensis TaxID=2842355 RepID=A0ABX8N7W1_9PSED|nr:tail fiber domain-containing protein [Pseudomonas fakonensis]QXH52441.1 tail fiber domain-containing protein [Pseudomonas fakonensis]